MTAVVYVHSSGLIVLSAYESKLKIWTEEDVWILLHDYDWLNFSLRFVAVTSAKVVRGDWVGNTIDVTYVHKQHTPSQNDEISSAISLGFYKPSFAFISV